MDSWITRHGNSLISGTCRFVRVLAFSCPILAAGAAESAEGQFTVRQAYAELIEEVYYLTARVDYALNDAALEALESGVPLTFELQIEVNRKRFLNDPNVAELLQRYELEFHALTDRYIVTNLNSGEQHSFPTLMGALQELGRVDRLPVLDRALLRPGKDYDIRVRAVLDVRDIPAALRWLLFWTNDWRIDSDWYKWRLQQ